MRLIEVVQEQHMMKHSNGKNPHYPQKFTTDYNVSHNFPKGGVKGMPLP